MVLVAAVAMGYPSGVPMGHCGRSAAGSASPCQGEGRGFESRRPLARSPNGDSRWRGREARQRPAKPCTRVQIPSPPRKIDMHGRLAQGLARFLDTEEVTGSNPVSPTLEKAHTVGLFACPAPVAPAAGSDARTSASSACTGAHACGRGRPPCAPSIRSRLPRVVRDGGQRQHQRLGHLAVAHPLGDFTASTTAVGNVPATTPSGRSIRLQRVGRVRLLVGHVLRAAGVTRAARRRGWVGRGVRPPAAAIGARSRRGDVSAGHVPSSRVRCWG